MFRFPQATRIFFAILVVGFLFPITSHSQQPIEIIKLIHNTPLSTFKTLYIEDVEANSVSYGAAEEKAKRDGEESKSLREAKESLQEGRARLRMKLKTNIAYQALPIEIINTAPPTSASALGIELDITEFNPGSRLTRAFLGLFGGGEVTVGVKGQFVDYRTHQPIAQFFHQRHAAWTYAGEGPDRLLFNAVDDIASDIAAYMADNWKGFAQ